MPGRLTGALAALMPGRLTGALAWLVVTVAAAVGVAGCGSPAPATSKPTTSQAVAPPGPENPRHPTVDVRFFQQVHTRVLADAEGYALYLYVPDHRKAVTCAATCAQSWPPVFRAPGARVQVGAGAHPGLVGSDRDPIHGRVVTYGGWPLYTYAEDAQPGFALGQALDIDGGYWYLVRPDGHPLIPPP